MHASTASVRALPGEPARHHGQRLARNVPAGTRAPAIAIAAVATARLVGGLAPAVPAPHEQGAADQQQELQRER